ncbi:MAG: chorismate mutase [Alphaproteobacteria bacterium]|nr:chorismate mutase [Alphaproteobacteria bacterium]
MEILKSYRKRIDILDEQIINLLRQRYDVIEEVGHLKARENIAAVLPERIDEVRENAVSQALAKGLDEAFIRNIYAQLIEHSCAFEEEIIKKMHKKDLS